MCTNPECGELLDVPENAAGRKIRCPSCGTVQVVGNGGTTKAAGEESAPQSAASEPSAAEKSSPPATAEPQSIPPAAESPPEGKPPAEPPEPATDADDLELADEAATETEPPASKPQRPAETPPADEEQAGDLGLLDAEDIELPAEERAGAPRDRSIGDLPDDLELVEDEESEPSGERESSAAPAPAEPAKRDAGQVDFDDAALLDAEDALAAEELFELEQMPPAEGDVLASRPAMAAIFVLGVVGIAAGAAAGAGLAADNRILGAYVGGTVGWIGGFIIAFLLAFVAERDEPTDVKCTTCGARVPAEADACGLCGAPAPSAALNPLAAQSLSAGGYAISNPAGLLWMVLLLTFATFVAAGTGEAMDFYGDAVGEYRVALYALGGLLGFVLFAYWMEYLLSTIPEAAGRRQHAPKAPDPFSPLFLLTGVKVVVVLLIYGATLIGLPLLPVALLAAGSPNRSGWANPVDVARAAWRSGREFAVCWLMILLWAAPLVLGLAVIVLLYHYVSQLGSFGAEMQVVVSLLTRALTALVGGLVAGVFALAIFRCIALFGRFKPTLLIRRDRPAAPLDDSPEPLVDQELPEL